MMAQPIPRRVAQGWPPGLIPGMLLAAVLALEGCATVPPPRDVDPTARAWRGTAALGQIAYRRGDLQEAARLYGEALDRARALDVPRAIGDLAYNLAVVMVASGDYARAEVLLAEAQWAQSLAAAPRGAAVDVALVLAQLRLAQYRRGDGSAPAVEAALAALATLTQEAPAPVGRRAELLHLEWACLRGEAVDIRRLAASPLETDIDTHGSTALALEAARTRVLGCVAQRRGAFAAAGAHFEREGDTWQRLGQPRAALAARVRAAQAHQRAGDYASATEGYYRAARGFGAWGESQTASHWLACARQNAHRSPDRGLEVLLDALEQQLSQQLAPQLAPPPEDIPCLTPHLTHPIQPSTPGTASGEPP